MGWQKPKKRTGIETWRERRGAGRAWADTEHGQTIMQRLRLQRECGAYIRREAPDWTKLRQEFDAHVEASRPVAAPLRIEISTATAGPRELEAFRHEIRSIAIAACRQAERKGLPNA